MSAPTVLLLTFGLTLIALAAQRLVQHRRAGNLRRLARDCSMHFCYGDRFGFAAKVAEHFPIPGVADVRVLDLFYSSRDQTHHYVFTVEYTRGVVRTKTRHRRVAAFVEPRGQRQRAIELRFADENQPILEQYRQLCGT